MLINKYLKNTQGNFAIMTSVIMGVLLVGVGVAIDIAGALKSKQELQGMLDMGLLAAATNTENAKNYGQNKKIDWSSITHNYMISNGYSASNPAPIVNVNGNFLTANLAHQYETSFGGFLGVDQMNINIGSQVTLKGTSAVQIALVLDNTDSMNPNGKMTALKDGARALVNAVEDGGSQSKIALVPFAKYVRLNTSYAGSPWLETPQEYDTPRTWEQATHSGGTCHLEDQVFNVDGVEVTRETSVCTGQTTTYETMHMIVESRWEGCVGIRDQPLDTLDGNYTTRIPGLLNRIPKELTGLYIDVEAWCPYEIIPLTNDYNSLKNHIGELYGTNKTYLPMGLTWGQRVLSPVAPFDEATPSEDIKNIMVIMSDGDNTAEIRDTAETNAEYQAPPYIYEAKDDEDVPNANTMTARLCSQIKAQGTEIYTIAFQISDPETKTLLQNCASSTSHSYDAGSNASLVAAFETIAESLESEIRITK